MKEHVKDLLVTALKSEHYTQTTTGRLKINDAYSCLGIICQLYAKTQKKKGFQKKNNKFYIQECKTWTRLGTLLPKKFKSKTLPTQVKKWAGMNSNTGLFVTKKGNIKKLTNLNNAGKSFQQIAKKIEKYWEQL